MHPILQPGRLGPLTLRNRVIKTATYEGMTPGGLVSPQLIEHHASMARHGVALTTVAYGAVAADGRTFETQLLLCDAARPGLRALADAVHAEGGLVSMQLAHCGGFSRNTQLERAAPGGPSPAINMYGLAVGVPRIRALDDAEIHGIVAAFAAAARLVVDEGFDAVEVHLGHGYLLSQFLSPAINRRTDAWGGDAARRMRLPVEVVRAVRAAIGPGRAIVVKLNLRDDVPGGLEVDGSIEVARAVIEAGADAIEPSGGLVNQTPFYLLRGNTPVRQMAEVEHSTLMKWALRLFAPFVIKPYAYTPLFFREDALRVRAAVQAPIILLGGVDSAAAMQTAMDDGFAFVAMGRALLADPDLLTRVAGGEGFVTRCDHCNICIAEMDRAGVRCVLPPL